MAIEANVEKIAGAAHEVEMAAHQLKSVFNKFINVRQEFGEIGQTLTNAQKVAALQASIAARTALTNSITKLDAYIAATDPIPD